jgi:hypothetical protein
LRSSDALLLHRPSDACAYLEDTSLILVDDGDYSINSEWWSTWSLPNIGMYLALFDYRL